MKNFILPICLFGINISCFATNYYVSENGSDGNNGTSVVTAFKNIQRAANVVNPGDSVLVLNGTYEAPCSDCEVVIITRSGTAAQPIVFINYQNQKPLIRATGWNGIYLKDGASYIEINGFKIKGNFSLYSIEEAKRQNGSCESNNPNGLTEARFNTNGIYADGRPSRSTGHPHHLKFLNNEIFDCGGGGIGTTQADYIVVKNNIIYNNCQHTLYGSSAITNYTSWNQDENTTEYKMIIVNNKCYNNILNVKWIGFNPAVRECKISDGNGIIIDDGRCTQTRFNAGNVDALPPYKGKTLITNNVCYNNGGTGIISFSSDNVDIINNTVYHNQRSPSIKGGDIFALDCENVRVFNNIIQTNPNNLDIDNNKKPITSKFNTTNVVFDYNLIFGGNGNNIDDSNSIKNVIPQFVNVALGNFKLRTTSPINAAIDKGNNTIVIYRDADGNARPQGNAIDIGAYETATNTINPLGNGTYILTAKHSGKVLDVKASSTENGAVVWQYTRNNGIAQQWQVASVGNGYYKLEAKCSNKALDVAGPSTNNGAALQQWGYNPNNAGNQDFKIEPTRNGFYKLTARNSGKVVEVAASNYNDQAAIIQWDYYNGDNQQWIFEKINNGLSSKIMLPKKVDIIQNKVTLNPNPTVNYTLVAYELKASSVVNIQLEDINQQLLKIVFIGKQTKGKYYQNINLGNFVKGIYLIKISIGNEPVITERIIKL
jgi:hypothetical protein